MIKKAAYLLFVLASIIPATKVWAAGAPPQLYNKTITVSYTDTGTGTMAVHRTIYVSAKGNIFVRTSRNTRGGSDSHDRAPGSATGTYRFEGGRLVGYVVRPSGAVQLTITFDPNFGSCTFSVLHGKASGQAYMTRLPSGKMHTVQGIITVSDMHCSITEGNPFTE